MEKPIHIQRVLIALGSALALVLAGCGTSPSGGVNGPSHAATSTTATASASAGTSASSATATASGATSGAVTLMVGAAQYAVSDRIIVTIRNGSSATIYVQQHNTSCSMILLEHVVNGAWQPVLPCVNSFPHPTVGRVMPGASFSVQLVPIVSGDAEATGGVQWPVGTYRAMLLYTTSQTTPVAQGTASYSGTFAVV